MYPQIVLFGDSITQFMTTNIQAWLQTRYSRRADIVNRGFGGYTSQQGLSLLPKIIPSLHPDTSPEIKLCFVFFGANDAFQPPQTPGRTRVDLEEFSRNISKIIEYLQSVSREMKVVLMTPPAVDEYSLPHTGLTSERIAAYASATRKVAAKHELSLVDCSKAFLKFSGWNENLEASFLPGDKRIGKNDALASLLTDGLHLSAKGYEVLFHEVVSVLEEELPQLSCSNMPVVICKSSPNSPQIHNLPSLEGSLTTSTADNELGAIWDDFGACDQTVNQTGYPVTEEDCSRALRKKVELEESIGMTIEEFFQVGSIGKR